MAQAAIQMRKPKPTSKGQGCTREQYLARGLSAAFFYKINFATKKIISNFTTYFI